MKRRPRRSRRSICACRCSTPSPATCTSSGARSRSNTGKRNMFFQSLKSRGPTSGVLTHEVKLKPGVTVLTVVAREDDEFAQREVLTVFSKKGDPCAEKEKLTGF